MSYATLTINLSAIVANYRLLQSYLGNVECAAVVKADAYGLGIYQVATALEKAGCKKFFVATLEEGIHLRQYFPSQKIYVFHGIMSGEEAEFIQYGLVPVLNSLEQLSTWNSYAKKQNSFCSAVLHIDTGMCRLGFSRADLELLENDPSKIDALSLEYVMSHLACADEAEHHKNIRQLMLFEDMPQFLHHIPRSLSNSSGVFLGEKYHFNLARTGTALYGVNPTPLFPNPMQWVVKLSAPIIQVREIDFPQTVGYGADYEVAAGSRIAVVPVGYADGYLRSLSSKGYCFIAGVQVPIIGRVSMDMITVDVTTVPQEKLYPGAEMEIIGEHCTVNDVAMLAGTIGYEILTNLGKRYKRVYLGN